LNDNQSALLEIAAAEPSVQIQKIRSLAQPSEAKQPKRTAAKQGSTRATSAPPVRTAGCPSPEDANISEQEVLELALSPPRQSGTSVHGRPRLSKQGASQLRKILFFPAIVAMRHNPIIREFAQRLADRGKAKMAIVCACMRKLLTILNAILKSKNPWEDRLAT